MWSAVRVSNGDGQECWLTAANGEGIRSIASDFKNAAIFWRRVRAEMAVGEFLRNNGQAVHEFKIVHLADDFYKNQP
jgi:hypothetical protein